MAAIVIELNIWFKSTTSYILLLWLDAEIQEKVYVSVTSRLNSNKELAAEIVRAVKAESKVWLIFVQGKRPQTMYSRRM